MNARPMVLICGIAALASGTTMAQERPPARDSVGILRPVRVDRVVVTGARLPVTTADLGFVVSVVSAGDLAATPRPYATDVLRTVPGSFIDEAAGPGGPTIIRLRGGEEVFTQILLDGIQINQNGGFFDFQGFTLNNVDRVEVARGPQSAVYGSSAVSGVVNFITRRGTAASPYLELVTEAGGHAGPSTSGLGGDLEPGGTFRAALNTGGGSGWFGYSVGLGHTYRRGVYARPHNTWTRDASVRLDATPSAAWQLTGITRFVGVESNLPVRDPGASRAPLDPNASNERDRIVSSLAATYSASSAWQHRVTASTYRERFLFDDQRDDVDPTGSLEFFVFDADFALRSVLWRTALEYTGTLSTDVSPLVGLNASYGARWERENLADSTSGEFGDGRMELDRASGALFAEAQMAVARRVSIVAGGRLEKYEGLSAEITPRASAVLSLVPDRLALRGTVGRAYKAPNLQQQFLDNPFIASNPDLEPETSWSWEVGADVDALDGALAASVTFFRQTFSNLIRTVAQEGSSQQINRNLGESRALGVEWDVQYRTPTAEMVGLSGWWTETSILDNSGLSSAEFPIDSVLPFRPDYQMTAYVGFDLGRRIDVTVRGTAVGPQTVLTERFSGDRVDIDGYVLLGADVGVRATRSLHFYGRVDNLFNRNYQTAYDRRGTPLTFAVGARFVRR